MRPGPRPTNKARQRWHRRWLTLRQSGKTLFAPTNSGQHPFKGAIFTMQTLTPFPAILAILLSVLSIPSDAAPKRDASVEVRLTSCDSTIVSAAARELLGDPKTLLEPMSLFLAASSERATGRKEEAAFLYLAARLRTSRQILFEKGDRPQLLAVMIMTLGPLIMPVLEADPELTRRVVRRVIDWDRSTADPFRERKEAKSDEIAARLAEIDAGLASLPEQIRDDPTRVAKARDANKQAEREIESTYAKRCGPGTLDAVDAELAIKRIKEQAERLAQAHPFVLGYAHGAVTSVNVGAWQEGAARLPRRVTVSVNSKTGKTFYAEINVAVAITADRKLSSVKFYLACITDLSIGQRDASWKDVCLGDPKAVKPTDMGVADLERFDIGSDAEAGESAMQKPICGFPELKLPAEFSVFAAGAYSGRTVSFQIDQSGHEGTQIDVTVNSPGKPVVLMLGAYEPTIWNIVWSKETRIMAALVGGYHRQVVAGLEKTLPLLVSSYDNQGPCGYFYIAPENLAPLNPLSKRVFGRPVDMVYPATNGKVLVGEPLAAQVTLVTSAETTPESFYDKTAPMAGRAGLEDATRTGLLRKATAADVEAWSEAVIQNSPPRDVPPVAGQGVPRPPKPPLSNAYVVLKPFTYPSGLYGGNSATFLILRGVPKPGGDPGHSAVYDFNTLNCENALCNRRPNIQ
jgi:hypothetical protein